MSLEKFTWITSNDNWPMIVLDDLFIDNFMKINKSSHIDF
jgi:hypothetical protein